MQNIHLNLAGWLCNWKCELQSQRLQREAFFTEGEVKKFDRSFLKVPGKLLYSA